MRDFISLNPLGCFYDGGGGIVTIHREIPEYCVGLGAPDPLLTPRDDGGVMVCGTSDLNLAINRNWRCGYSTSTSMGIELTLTIDPTSGFGSSSDYVNTISPNFVFTLGDSITSVSSSPGEDFTMGDPRRARESLVHPLFVVGHKSQLNIESGIFEPLTPVYVGFVLDWVWHGYRFWSGTTTAADVTAVFAFKVAFEIYPEVGYSFTFSGGSKPAMPTLVSNWLVDDVPEMADWGLLTTFPGGSPFSEASAYQVAQSVSCGMQFIDEPLPPMTIPVRSLYSAGAATTDAVTVDNLLVGFPVKLDPLASL